MEYPYLFSPGKIGTKQVPNRFVSQAMEGNDGVEGGGVSERTLARYLKLAEGGWGIVIVEALSVTDEFIARPNGLVISQRNLDGLQRLVQEFKERAPNTLLLFQLTHSGRHSRSRRVCLYPSGPGSEGADLLTTEEVETIKNQFVEAALLAEEAGADGVDFKICHGYFGAEMLRPANTRKDRWGGSFENRTRFIREIVSEFRERSRSREFLLGSRLSFYEAIRGGCGTAGPDEILEDLTEMLQVVSVLRNLGMHYVNVSAGIPSITAEVTRPTKVSELFTYHHFRYAALARAQEPSLATIGSAYSVWKEEGLRFGEENVRKGYTDFVGFGRQSFADPLFPQRVKNGEKPIQYCTACSGCTRLMVSGMQDGCIVYNPYYKELHKELLARGRNKSA